MKPIGDIIYKQWVLGEITVVWIKIDTLVIKKMTLAEGAERGTGVRGQGL
jgi:hypothetical protein